MYSAQIGQTSLDLVVFSLTEESTGGPWSLALNVTFNFQFIPVNDLSSDCNVHFSVHVFGSTNGLKVSTFSFFLQFEQLIVECNIQFSIYPVA